MQRTNVRYLMIGATALLAGLLIADTPVQAVLPLALVLACPLMMLLTHGTGRHGTDGGSHDGHDRAVHRDSATDGR